MKSKIVGYVLIATDGAPFMRGEHEDEKNVLWFGDHASIFESRKIIKKLVTNSRKFADSHNYKWPWLETANIYPLRISK